MSSETTQLVTYRILTRNGVKFVGALSRTQCYQIWVDCFKLNPTLLHGISLVQSPGRPFLTDFHLHEELKFADFPKTFSCLLDGSTYQGELLKEDSEIPLLGEEVKIFIRRTRFRLAPVQIKVWLSVFGTLIDEIAYVKDPELPHVSTDDLSCRMILKRHIYGQLPAFGRKLRVSYKGQPIQCGACFGLGHIRSECTEERLDWLKYCKILIAEFSLATSMLGRWHNLMVENKI